MFREVYSPSDLKMSRVGVWSRIDKLRKLGLSIEAAQKPRVSFDWRQAIKHSFA